tara:strand:+ start:419 stop:592 length:174 start_codon:yes stop_codon:yes gene_type:complete
MHFLILNLGFSEIALVFIVYLIFFGPNNFPSLMRDFGRFFYKIKRSLSDLYRDFDLE